MEKIDKKFFRKALGAALKKGIDSDLFWIGRVYSYGVYLKKSPGYEGWFGFDFTMGETCMAGILKFRSQALKEFCLKMSNEASDSRFYISIELWGESPKPDMVEDGRWDIFVPRTQSEMDCVISHVCDYVKNVACPWLLDLRNSDGNLIQRIVEYKNGNPLSDSISHPFQVCLHAALNSGIRFDEFEKMINKNISIDCEFHAMMERDMGFGADDLAFTVSSAKRACNGMCDKALREFDARYGEFLSSKFKNDLEVARCVLK